jgi:uncharacterized repeat protein (TIGR01451 family)
MKNHLRYLLSTAIIIALSVFLLPSISAKRHGIKRTAIDHSSSIDEHTRAGRFQFVAHMLPFANLMPLDEGFTDLSVSKTASADQVSAGSNVTYTIQVINGGPDVASSVELNDPLPAGMTFVSLTKPDSWTCTTPAVGDDGTINCVNPSLAVTSNDSGDTFKLVAKVPSETPADTFFTNIATISSATPDINDENNSAPASTMVAGTSVDLGVAKLASAEQILPGSNLTYTIQVSSGGVADNAKLTDTLPGTLTFVSLTKPDNWTCTTPAVGAGGTIECTNASLAATSGDVFTLVTQVPPDASAGTIYDNTATITSTTADPNEENNSSSVTTAVGTGVNVTGTKSVEGSTTPGSIMSYNIVLSNSGTNQQRNNPGSEFIDMLPAELTLISAHATDGNATINPGTNTVAWNGAIPGLSSVTINIMARIKTGTAGQTITNQGMMSFDADDNGTNESSVLTDNPSVSGATNPTSFVVSCNANPVVTSNTDNGQGSLRHAINDACPGGTISFDPTIFNPAGGPYTITLTSGALSISKSLTITGIGANLLTVRRDNAAATQFRIFTISSGTVAISGLTVSNGNGGINNNGNLTLTGVVVSGNTDVSGGGIRNFFGTLTLLNSTISGNNSATGGGLYNDHSTVTVTNSTISGNTATGSASSRGGGIYNTIFTDLTINASTISDNASINGGGIYNDAFLTIKNSTLSGNRAETDGGGLLNSGGSTAVLTNVTVTNNRADSDGNASGAGGGIAQMSFNPVTLRNTIVAGNFKGASPATTADDVSGAIDSSSANNLIGTDTGLSGITNGSNSNQIGTSAAPINPRLGLLASNGGQTRTHALLSGSPALDAGSNTLSDAAGLTTDQRGTGFTRKVDAADADLTATVDIGAFEAQVSIQDITDKATNEDTPLSFTFNVGEAGQIISVTATSSNNTLVPNNPANLSVSGSGSTRTLNITPAAKQSGTTTITVTVNGNNSQAMSDTFILTVNPVNDAPVNTVPGAQSVNENGSLIFSNANAISIADPDAGANPVQVTLTANNGQITLSSTSGLSFTVGDGVADAQMTFTGAIANINAALNGLVFTPAPGYDGAASLQIVTNDQGNTGVGGALTDTDNVNINVLDGGTLAFSAATYTVSEGAGSVTITVNRTGGNAGEARINYTTSNGTATAGQDYTAASGTLVFASGVTTQTFNISITDDVLAEADETVQLTLSNVAGTGSLGTPSTATLTIMTDNDVSPALLQLSASTYSVTEDGLHAIINVNRLGDTSQPSRVDFATSDLSGLNPCSQFTGNASSRCDYATSVGTLRFNAGETSKTIFIPIVNDVYLDGPEVFTLTLSNPVGAGLSGPIVASITIIDDDTAPAPNPIDNDAFFIRQLYIDFLGREPEPGAINAWLGILNHCAVSTDCDRAAVAQGFVRSEEFQERGYFIYRFYSATLGRIPHYNEFIPDMARVSGFLSTSDLELNKAAYVEEFMSRQEFKDLYDSTLNNPTAYVEKLLQAAGLPNHSGKAGWINGLTNGTLSRAQVLRQLVESTEVYAKYYNEAFVIMNYFGFLRRDADAAYTMWLQMFNNTGDHRQIINGFINSTEYRFRFGP